MACTALYCAIASAFCVSVRLLFSISAAFALPAFCSSDKRLACSACTNSVPNANLFCSPAKSFVAVDSSILICSARASACMVVISSEIFSCNAFISARKLSISISSLTLNFASIAPLTSPNNLLSSGVSAFLSDISFFSVLIRSFAAAASNWFCFVSCDSVFVPSLVRSCSVSFASFTNSSCKSFAVFSCKSLIACAAFCASLSAFFCAFSASLTALAS